MGAAPPPPTSMESKFEPEDLTSYPPIFSLPNELWLSVLQSTCPFSTEPFLDVMQNLLKNPNITSSHLFRAEIYYDSLDKVGATSDLSIEDVEAFTKHMKAELRPHMLHSMPGGFYLQRTVVRNLIPRNPQLDKAMVQTCHFLKSRSNHASQDESEERNLVFYLPHVDRVEDMPWYHPTVKALVFLHRRKHQSVGAIPSSSSISIHYSLFPASSPPSSDTPPDLDTRLSRTAFHLLRTVHKHGVGTMAGYEKRVHHDLIISQARFQDTYTQLKIKYAKRLAEGWAEQTDPTKHVFEDLGIAAFLIELWSDMYSSSTATKTANDQTSGTGQDQHHVKEIFQKEDRVEKPPFPGFVDIGCGNGVLVYILLSEGYSGWGFDARRRKTWSTFPAAVQGKLEERLFVPSIFRSQDKDGAYEDAKDEMPIHDGLLEKGTFIISNHADELTAWTPLLSFLNDSPFIAIPCCSHNFAGAKFRAPLTKARSSRKMENDDTYSAGDVADVTTGDKDASGATQSGHPNTERSGSLKRTGPKAPSAYSSLCSWVSRLAEDVGYVPEKEMLRIPSTRNEAIVGKKRMQSLEETRISKEREQTIKDIIERETGMSSQLIGEEWMRRCEGLRNAKGGH